MTGSAAAKATEAADALLDWLGHWSVRHEAASGASKLENAPLGEDLAEGASDFSAAVSAPGRIARALDPRPSDPACRPAMRLATPDWLRHRLAIAGPAAEMDKFRRDAAGAGIIPWRLDVERMEEDWFHLLVASERSGLGIAGARIFARQLRDAVATRHALAVSRVGHSQACPFDLHALVPVPPGILDLGPDAPESLAWLWAHWGTTEALRHVAEEEGGAADGGAETRFRLTFWSADWTPWRALAALGPRWPSLRFEVCPIYVPSP